MEVQFQQSVNDYYAAQRYVCRKIVRGSYWRFVPGVLGGVFGFSLALGLVSIGKFYEKYQFLDFYELNWGLGIMCLGFVAFIFGLRWYNRAIKPKIFNPDGLYRSLHSISLTDTHLVMTVRNNKYTYAYSDILKVEEDAGYVFAFIDNGAALYIPSKAFVSEETKKDFINELSKKIKR
jgi:hypothetical protein